MEFNNTMPIYLQVIQDIKKDMVKGNLKLGDKLPSARDLGIHYQINPNTANRIYRELEQMELCYTKRGLGTYVTEDSDKLKTIRKEMAEAIFGSFLSDMKDLGYRKSEVIAIINEKYEEES